MAKQFYKCPVLFVDQEELTPNQFVTSIVEMQVDATPVRFTIEPDISWWHS